MPSPVLSTRLTREYDIRHPLAAAGMGFVGGNPAFAMAVCRAGGVGAFAAGPMPAPALRDAIGALTGGLRSEPFNVNLITTFVDDAHVDVCAELGVPVVSFHWAHPHRCWIERLREAGVRVWEQVGSVDAARRAVDAGVDLVVAQGLEAGGHNYATLPTFAFVPAVVDAVGDRALVLAAGGVSDGRGLAAALALGADGVWVGTRLVASDEAHAHPEYKRRLVAAAGEDTCLTSIFGPEMPSFNPMRVLRNRVVTEHEGVPVDQLPSDRSGEPEIGRTRLGGEEVVLRRLTNMVPTPDTTGDLDEMPLLAGSGVGLVAEILPVERIIDSMVAEAAAVLASHGPASTSSRERV